MAFQSTLLSFSIGCFNILFFFSFTKSLIKDVMMASRGIQRNIFKEQLFFKTLLHFYCLYINRFHQFGWNTFHVSSFIYWFILSCCMFWSHKKWLHIFTSFLFAWNVITFLIAQLRVSSFFVYATKYSVYVWVILFGFNRTPFWFFNWLFISIEMNFVCLYRRSNNCGSSVCARVFVLKRSFID